MCDCCLQGEEAAGGVGRLRARLDGCAELEEEAQAAGGGTRVSRARDTSRAGGRGEAYGRLQPRGPGD